MFGFLLAHYPVNNLGNRLIGKCNDQIRNARNPVRNTAGCVCRLRLRAPTKTSLVNEKTPRRPKHSYYPQLSLFFTMSGRGYRGGHYENSYSSNRGGYRGRGSNYRGGYKGTRYDPYYNSRNNDYGREHEYSESYDNRELRESHDSREARSGSHSSENYEEQHDNRPSLGRYRGSNYRGSNYRGSGFRGGHGGHGGHHSERSSFLSERGARNGSFSDTHSSSRESGSVSTAPRKTQDPWILILKIKDEKTQVRLDASHRTLASLDRQLVELQKGRLRLEASVAHLERNAVKEALNVQSTHEKLEEFAFL